MSAEKYPRIFSRKKEVIVYIYYRKKVWIQENSVEENLALLKLFFPKVDDIKIQRNVSHKLIL